MPEHYPHRKRPPHPKNKQNSPPQNQYSRLTFILSMMLLVPSTLYFLSRLPMECFSAQKVLPAPGRPTIMMICRQSTQHWHTSDTVIPTFINSFTNTTPPSTSGMAIKTAHVAVVKWKIFQESKSVQVLDHLASEMQGSSDCLPGPPHPQWTTTTTRDILLLTPFFLS